MVSLWWWLWWLLPLVCDSVSLVEMYRCSEEYVPFMFRKWCAASHHVAVNHMIHDMISSVCSVWQCGVQGNECGDVSSTHVHTHTHTPQMFHIQLSPSMRFATGFTHLWPNIWDRNVIFLKLWYTIYVYNKLDVLYWNSASNFFYPGVSDHGRQLNIIQKAWEIITMQVDKKCIIARVYTLCHLEWVQTLEITQDYVADD
jgi:hypothetical protein